MPKGAEQVNTQRTLTKRRRIRLQLTPTPTHGLLRNTITKETGRGTEPAAGQKW